MAIYHFHAAKGQQGKHSSRAKHDYIQRKGKYHNTDGEVVTFGNGNMPTWAESDPRRYWQAVDEGERANGRLYRQYEMSLPNELNLEQQRQLVAEIVEEITTAKEGKLPFSYAIHKGENHNPHLHLMVSERANDGLVRSFSTWCKRANRTEPEKGGAIKADGLERKERLLELRQAWADMANAALERAGHIARIDHRSLIDQGINREPMPHIGPAVLQMEERGILTGKGQKALEAVARNENRSRQVERGPECDGVSRADRTTGTEYGGPSGRFEGANRKKQDRACTDTLRGPESLSGACDGIPDSQGKDRSVSQGSPNGSFSREGGERIKETLDNTSIFAYGNSCFDSSTDRVLFLGDVLQRKSKVSAQCNAEGRMARQSIQQNGRGYTETIQRNVAVENKSNRFNGEEEISIKEDRTTEAVKNQIRAMDCKAFDIGIRDRENNKMMHREALSPEQVLMAIPWLKRMNAKGNDIYIRPNQNEQRSLILVDDIDGITIENMKSFGCSPACVIETSYKNLQAWVSIGKEQMPEAQRKDLSAHLANKFEGDKGSVGAQHFGRLAGFTNRKPEYLRNGGYPYVLCKESSGKEAEKAPELRLWAERKEQVRERIDAIQVASRVSISRYHPPAGERYKKEMAEWLQAQGKTPDWSKGDYAVACEMLKSGYLEDEIAKAMVQHSPDIANRKEKHIEDYVHRTIQAAGQNWEVKQAIEQRAAREFARRQEGHGFSM